ncbi:hypothetical protein R6Z07F_003708 [Ovis aries]
MKLLSMLGSHVQADMDEAASSTCWMESDSEGLGHGPRDPAFVCPGLHDVRAAEGQVRLEALRGPEVPEDEDGVDSQSPRMARAAEALDSAGAPCQHPAGAPLSHFCGVEGPGRPPSAGLGAPGEREAGQSPRKPPALRLDPRARLGQSH